MSEPDHSAPPESPEEPETVPARRFPGPPWLPWAIGGVLALVVVIVAILLLTGGDDAQDPSTPATVEVVGPEPTPVGEPVARGEGSALFLALPDAVRQYVVTAIAPSDAFAAAAAIESVAATYTGPLDGADVDYAVVVGQWPTPEEAAAHAATLVAAAGAPLTTGEVTAAGVPAGTYSILGVDDATSTVVWTNGTLVLQATGPAADIENFYLAFSL